MRTLRLDLVVLLSFSTLGCSSTEEDSGAATGTHVLSDYGSLSGFFSAPFPDDARLDEAGHPVLDGFPNPTASVFVDKMLTMLGRDARGFSSTAGIFMSLSGPLDPGVDADYSASVAEDARVFLVDVDDASPNRGARMPVMVHFAEDGGPFGAANLLSLVPLQGAPLRPLTRYAAVILRTVPDAEGHDLAVPTSLRQIRAGHTPDGMSAAAFNEHRAALAALDELGVDNAGIAGLAVFTTDDPTRDLFAVRDAMLAPPIPKPLAPFTPQELFPDFCVYESTIEMPVFQAGEPPFQEQGGEWQFDASGAPIAQGEETARVVVTLPRRTMPASGFPTLIFSRTGGGGDRPLVDRGVQAETGGPALEPGTGPALELARAGWAGISVDGPHGGLRNVTGGDEQFLMFNVTNPAALRDNVRQSAAELALQAHVLSAIAIDASGCPGLDSGANPAKLDPATLALMGHSMGATIAPLTLGIEPAFRAGILSGAGGSWIENVLYKKKPLPVKGFAELLLGVAGTYSLTESDPALSLFQWAAEPADPPVYARGVIAEPKEGDPRHVLMVQGIVDHYILPPIANATSLSLGLDFAGEALDESTPEVADMPHLSDVIQFSRRTHINLPASGNVTGSGKPTTTAIVVQQKEDGVEDGHEVVFQTEPPKHQYRCFLETLLQGPPLVPMPASGTAPCQ